MLRPWARARFRRLPFAALFSVSFALACSADRDAATDRTRAPGGGETSVPADERAPHEVPDTSSHEPAPADSGSEQTGEIPSPSDDGVPPRAPSGGDSDEAEPDADAPIDDPDVGKGGTNSAGAGGTTGTEVPIEPGEAGAPSSSGGSAGAFGSGGRSGGGSHAGVGGSDANDGGVSGGKAGAGGNSGAGGNGGKAGEAATGGGAASGGSGGAPPVAGARCSACGNDDCAAAFARCDASPACSRWLDCVSACPDAACARACDESHRDPVLLTVPVYQCLCQRCSAECAPLEVCGRTCEEGAAPPLPASSAPAVLGETGLYARNGRIAPYVRRYRPEYELFSDFSVKERFVYLPRCSRIDTRDMDHWSLPVGTRLWKQFTRDGVRIETRMLARYGRGEGDWVMASYRWPQPTAGAELDPSRATLAPEGGVSDVNGTAADIPSLSDCRFCHERLSERALGFGAIQLSHALGGVTFTDLVDWGVLSNARVRTGYDPPGDATARAALGYLHANCGGCHNDTGIRVSMHLRLLVSQTTVETTSAFTTAVDVRTSNANFRMDRIEPGNPEESAIIVRMLRNPSAGEPEPMPPLGREFVHTDGVATVSAWIRALAP